MLKFYSDGGSLRLDDYYGYSDCDMVQQCDFDVNLVVLMSFGVLVLCLMLMMPQADSIFGCCLPFGVCAHTNASSPFGSHADDMLLLEAISN